MARPFTPEDLLLHRKLSGLHARPDADVVVCTVRSTDTARDGHGTRLWLWHPRQDRPVALDLGHAGTQQGPALAPGALLLAFVGSAGDTRQVHLAALPDGLARPVGRFAHGVQQLRWWPDGRTLLVTATVAVDPDAHGGRPPAGGPPPRGPHAPEVAWRLPYKNDGTGYLLAREQHLFRLQLDGQARQLTDGDFSVFGADVAPDGSRIAYVRSSGGRYAHRSEVWACRADGDGHALLSDVLAMASEPVWSPDDSRLALLGARDEGDARAGLWLLDAGGGAPRRLGGEDFETAGFAPQWVQDGRALRVVQAWRGRHRVVEIDADGQAPPRVLLAGDRQFGAYAASAARLLVAADAPTQPSELRAAGLYGGGERCCSAFNAWWNERTPIRCEARSFDVPDGDGGSESIEGWLLRGPHDGPAPLLDDVHGGPAAYALLDYDTNVYWQVLCSRGWAVLVLNPVGSASYGRRFCDRLRGRWGGIDLPQHLAALDRLRADGVCDERLALAGKSYGGFLAAWALGHADAFRAAVVMSPVGNLETHHGTSDGGWYADPYYLGPGHAFDREHARRLSPVQAITRARAPTLFLQGKADERTPQCQSEELFTSLARAQPRLPTELVLYPGCDHHFLNAGPPSVRIDAAHRITQWLATHAAGGASGA